MRYIISNNVALRSWKLVPCAFYVRGHQYAQRLSREQFELLKRCDGVQELEQTELLRLLERAGVVREARPGETWSEWSRPHSFGNRYFPCVNWAITGKCNFNCRHCFMAADNAPMLGEFSWEECVSFLDECERCGIQSVTLTGGPGCGQHTKMANQIAIAGTLAGVCEAIAYARAVGLDVDEVLAAIGGGAAGSWQLANNGPKSAHGYFAPGFFIKHFIKDMTLADGEARERDLPMPVLEKVLAMFRALEAHGYGNEGTQALIRAYE